MQIRILGYHGSIGADRHTTSILVDDDILIDAGTGVLTLSLAEMLRVRHIFVTHSHLDHVASIPLMLDSIFSQIETPVTVHGRPETLAALRAHIFNWTIWPDFSVLPRADRPVMRFDEVAPGSSVALGKRMVHAIPVNHVVPALGYCVETAGGAFAFSGDTTTNDTFWESLNGVERLDVLLVESPFSDKDLDIARRSGHYCPRLLAADLPKLRHRPNVYISHPKPGSEELILHECQSRITGFAIHGLTDNDVFRI